MADPPTRSEPTTPRKTSEPPGPRLSRALILDRAIRLIDAQGVTALTMRALGASLGVEAMSLYRYVNGREDLLEGVVEQLVGSIEVEPGERMEPNDGWQAFLQWFAHDVRRLALEHPAAFPLIATRHPAAPWLRPPLRSLRIVEAFLNGLRERGFTDHQAVTAYRSFSSFLLGHLLLECAMSCVGTSFAEEPVDEGNADLPNDDAQLDLTDYPTVARLQPQLTEDHTRAEFEEALEHLLVRMDLEMSQ
ncbi:MAG: TetR/AcrR family transcriptional regulator C-terminal domain-containing protein [Humibacillus sp.]|nr:TetR/AcrR family transcriptional regulator C-terminal domain-containing protein [Humibacillus sp.]MDN5775737.1 TetR/AcrR family transcriptional regulator C-terminal domain-containing protein [Humibacillus sp.]